MATQRTAKPPASKAVFINCPFDDGFKPIFRAMVFAVIASGYEPRCALDATDGAEIRVSKIAKMIGECDWGIHDLSRVEVDATGVPRFNMPMELGLHLGARLFGAGRHRRKRALILEAQPLIIPAHGRQGFQGMVDSDSSETWTGVWPDRGQFAERSRNRVHDDVPGWWTECCRR